MTTSDDEIAMQPRCVHCLREQWAVVVHPVSHGEAACAWCGKTSTPMTVTQYRDALRAARAAQQRP